MLKIIISGCCGAMGRVVNNCVAADENLEVVAGIDKANEKEIVFYVFNKNHLLKINLSS